MMDNGKNNTKKKDQFFRKTLIFSTVSSYREANGIKPVFIVFQPAKYRYIIVTVKLLLHQVFFCSSNSIKRFANISLCFIVNNVSHRPITTERPVLYFSNLFFPILKLHY